MASLKQSTVYTRMFLLVDSADHVTGKTGVTPTVTLSKAGAAFGAAAGAITEVSSGWYKIAYTTADTNTLGDLAVHVTGTGCDATDFTDQVSARQTDDLAYPATSGRSIVVDAAGLVDANMVKMGPTGAGTAQTGRDVGASVLLSSGTGTGQLDFTSGVVKANLAQILATAITETTGGFIAAAFKKFFDKATPTGTINSIPDAVAGATGGLFIAGTNAATTVTTALTTTFTGNLSGSVGSVAGAVGSVTGAVGSVTGNVGGNVVGSVASVTAGVTVTTNNDKTGYGLSAAAVQAVWDALTSALTTVGSIGKLLATDIDAAISSRSTYAGGAVSSVTGNVGGNVVGSVGSLTTNNDKTGYALSGGGVQAIWDALTSALTTPGSIGKWIVDKLDVIVSTRLATSGYTAPLDAAGTRAAIGLASANLDTQIDALPTAAENADAYLDRADAIEVGLTPRQAQRLFAAALAGKLGGAATSTVTIRNAVADSKARITATVDADGNRSAITTDVT